MDMSTVLPDAVSDSVVAVAVNPPTLTTPAAVHWIARAEVRPNQPEPSTLMSTVCTGSAFQAWIPPATLISMRAPDAAVRKVEAVIVPVNSPLRARMAPA